MWQNVAAVSRVSCFANDTPYEYALLLCTFLPLSSGEADDFLCQFYDVLWDIVVFNSVANIPHSTVERRKFKLGLLPGDGYLESLRNAACCWALLTTAFVLVCHARSSATYTPRKHRCRLFVLGYGLLCSSSSPSPSPCFYWYWAKG